MKRSIFALIAGFAALALFSSCGTSHRLQSYVVNMPSVMLDSLHTAVYVMPFTNKGGIPSNAGERIARAISQALDDDNVGVKNSKDNEILRLNPLAFTQWHHSARTKNEADVLVDGTYTASINGYSECFQEHSYEANYDNMYSIPFTYFRFVEMKVGSIMGDVFVYKNGETMPIITLPLDVTVKDSSVVYCRPKNPISDSEMLRRLEDTFVEQATHIFNPYLTVETYTFNKLKTSNKAISNEIDALNKKIEKEIDDHDIFKVGELYLEALALEESNIAHENLGFCYEIIGNLPQALRHYEMARAYQSIDRVTAQLRVRDILESFGYKFEDKEFRR